MGTSSNSLDRNNELFSSSDEVHWPRKNRGPFEGLDIHVLQRTSPTDKSFVEKARYFFRGLEQNIGATEGKQPSGSSSSLQKQESASTCAKQGQESAKEKAKGKGKILFLIWNPYPQNYRIPNKEKKAIDNVLNMARTLMEFKNKAEERMNQSFPNK
ncbi:hypothetical protein O181_006572 [Austropuccinia psidii MF-1]|uniref:Uncharacterized protein n=1 Tax=Austropuccinia psidii MF-1 TaxID=1389203 RepID=A0A9Q3GHQ2_9BASI|nr:hypothetical protein [Austropuccinia psidii MF-1]